MTKSRWTNHHEEWRNISMTTEVETTTELFGQSFNMDYRWTIKKHDTKKQDLWSIIYLSMCS